VNEDSNDDDICMSDVPLSTIAARLRPGDEICRDAFANNAEESDTLESEIVQYVCEMTGVYMIELVDIEGSTPPTTNLLPVDANVKSNENTGCVIWFVVCAST
jgi:hypothetical protein